MNRTIMIVDDEKMITTTLTSLIRLSLKQKVLAFNDPVQAIESIGADNNAVDLVISDFMMPYMNGLEFLKAIKQKNPECITILLTGYADRENAIRSINEVGLYYYLEKPWDNNALIKVIQNGLEKKELSDSLKVKFRELEESTREISRLYQLIKKDYNEEVDNMKSLIISLANLIEAKDIYTDGHTRRVGEISRLLGIKMGLNQDSLQYLEISGIIHDLGKVAIPENILNKKGLLTEEEFNIIKKHTVIGENICRPLNCLEKCLDPIRHHHEKLNGSGYPDSLKESQISLEARIICVADIFDALYSDRPYRSKLPMDQVKAILQEEVTSGCLDGDIVQILVKMINDSELKEIIG